MKLGILTLPLEINYGGILQNYALQRALCKLGHEAITIDRHNRVGYPSFARHLMGYSKRILQHYLRHRNVTVKWNPFLSEEEFKKLTENTQRFINKNINLTYKVYSDQLEKIDHDYQFDGYVVGSDQVWLNYYCPDSFLSFVKRKNVKKVIYAASCGKRSFFNDDKLVRECSELAKSFNGISVREKSLVSKCESELGVSAEFVLDPTLLLTPEEYKELLSEKMNDEAIVFSYILDNNNKKQQVVSSVAGLLNLPIVSFNCDVPDRIVTPQHSVEEWINNIMRANFIVTDSFHGTVMSILFNKQFITICNESRGSGRFESVLNLFNLKSRIIDDSNAFDLREMINSAIVYDKVNEIINKQRAKSVAFILNSLK